MKTENVNKGIVGLWCENCIAFLDHTVVLNNTLLHEVSYSKTCSVCKKETKNIVVALSIWREIESNFTK